MSHAEELLDTAKALLRRNRNKPSQSDIRRSISTAYYALFHFLIEAGTSQLLEHKVQQQALGRAYSHTLMLDTCESVIKQPVPPIVVPLLGTSIHDELRKVANTFSNLQNRRHEADYDLALDFTRNEGYARIEAVEDAIAAWAKLNSSIVRPFLILLLIGRRSLR